MTPAVLSWRLSDVKKKSAHALRGCASKQSDVATPANEPDDNGDEAGAHCHVRKGGALQDLAQSGLGIGTLGNDDVDGDARLGRAGRGAAAEAVQQLGHAQGALAHGGAEGGGLSTVRGRGEEMSQTL